MNVSKWSISSITAGCFKGTYPLKHGNIFSIIFSGDGCRYEKNVSNICYENFMHLVNVENGINELSLELDGEHEVKILNEDLLQNYREYFK